jgi:MFS family permease
MVFITLLVRRGVDESPEFVEAEKEDAVSEFPVTTLLRTQLRATVIVFVAAFNTVISTIVIVFGLSYATQEHGVDRSTMLAAIAASQVVALFFHPLFGFIADRIGRKVVYVSGCLLCAVGVFAFLGAISTGSTVLIVIATVGLKGVVYSAPNALWPSFFAEMFTPNVRYTGVAVSTQLSFLLTGFAPTICYALIGGDDNWVLAASAVAGICVLAAAAARISTKARVESRQVLAHT